VTKMMMRPEPLTWTDARNLFEQHLLARRSSEGTLRAYRSDLGGLVKHLSRGGEPPAPEEVTLDDLRAYQVGLLSGQTARSKRPLMASSVARVTVNFRCFFAWLAAEGKIPADPTLRLETPRVPKRIPAQVLSQEDTRRLIAGPSTHTPLGLRDKAILELLYATGLRRAELCALDLSDLDHEERQVIVRHGKGDKARVVPVIRSAYQAVLDYLERVRPVLAKAKVSSALFLTRLGERISVDSLASVVTRGRLAAGINEHVRPHDLRRAFATGLAKNGANLRHVQVLLGHARLDTTAIYLGIDMADVREELLLKHPRERIDA